MLGNLACKFRPGGIGKQGGGGGLGFGGREGGVKFVILFLFKLFFLSTHVRSNFPLPHKKHMQLRAMQNYKGPHTPTDDDTFRKHVSEEKKTPFLLGVSSTRKYFFFVVDFFLDVSNMAGRFKKWF